MNAYESLRVSILEQLRTHHDATDDRAAVEKLVRGAVDRHQADAAKGTSRGFADPEATVDRLMAALVDAGAFTAFFNDPELATEVGVLGDVITASMTGGRQRVVSSPSSEDENLAVIRRLLGDAGADINAEHPIAVTQIWDERVRASVSIPPISDELDATFRIYRSLTTTLDQLVEWGSLSVEAAQFLAAVQLLPSAGQLFSGPPGAGKTTLASAALGAVPETTNVRIIQEARELDAPHHPGGRWSPEGGGHTIRSLVNRALQFAPGLLVVGETRGSEAFELLKASNSGCAFMTTLHAKSARMAMESLVVAALMAGENVPERAVRRSFGQLIDVVAHCAVEPLHLVEPGRPRLRQVMEISTVPNQLFDDGYVLEPVFSRRALGAPMEFRGANSLGELGDELDAVLTPGVTALGLCEGTCRLP